MKKKRFYIKTLGCKVNQYESQVIREGFLENGYTEADNYGEADICVVNTCTVTSASDSKSLKSIRSGLRKRGGRVIATGCMVESRDLDLHKLKGVDFIIKNKDKYNIPKLISESLHPSPFTLHQQLGSITSFAGHARAFVKIQDGCDNRCSYCKVSIVRGKSRSRPSEDIVKECSALIQNGYKEIVLTGICLGAYGRDISKDANLSKLVTELCKIKGKWRIRLSSIEPKDITGDLISQIKSEQRLCKHIHIPFQSGDDEILKRMARPYTADDYIGIVAKLRGAVPDVAISTDIMVGFPGEKEANFKNTVDFIKKIKPMRLHAFGFSKRPGTPAHDYNDSVSRVVKKKREHELMNIVKGFSKEFEAIFIGKDANVLVEGERDKNGFLQGYTDRYIKVLIDGPDSAKSSLITCQLALTPPLLPEEQANNKARAGLTNQKVYGILFSYLD